jgi:hypothetical protein
MDLSAHARAAHILGDAFEGQAAQRTDSDAALMLMSIATAYRVAAGVMDKEIRAAVIDHRCTINHQALTVPQCPACKKPKGSPQ